MHQTFYIDADEEVNSVISKLRKSSSKYNILVIAQRALILQSAVSLKLIKREINAVDKKVMIVTQDERGLSIARKAGFPTRKTIDNIKQKKSNKVSGVKKVERKDKKVVKKTAKETETEINKKISDEKKRLNNLGVSEYVLPNQGLVGGSELVHNKAVGEDFFERDNKVSSDFLSEEQVTDNSTKTKEEEFNDLFITRKNNASKKETSTITTSQRAGKLLKIFIAISFIMLLGVLGYLFLPEAEIKIFPKENHKNFSINLKAVSGISDDKKVTDGAIKIGADVLEIEDMIALVFDTTGEGKSSNQKARGRITIYNDFSEASQVLVATTRFLTEDGKLFRLTSGVVVPGKSNNEAGRIEAEVIADKAGDEYNIEATEFKIPGFKGSQKYDKFYAKSEQKMRGGGESNGKLKSVSQSDIVNAKKIIVDKLKLQLRQRLEREKGEGNIIIPEALNFEIIDTAAFPGKDAVTDNFEYQARIKATALIFSDKKVEDSLRKYLKEKLAEDGENMKIVSLNKKYDQPTVNLEENQLVSNIEVSVDLRARVNLEGITTELLGKNQQEIDEVIGGHPEVQKIEALVAPSFLGSRIPKYDFRVKAEIAK